VLGISLLAVSAASASLNLIEVIDQSITHKKSLHFSVFGQGTTLAGESATYSAAPGAPSFTSDWMGNPTYSGVTLSGDSSLDYDFSNDIFTFSTATDSSHNGTSTESITANPRGSGQLSIAFTLNEAAMVYFAAIGLVDNNGNGGSGGGSPYASASFQKLVGYNADYGFPLYESVFPNQFVFDSTVGNGSDQFNFSGSALLEPGDYQLDADVATQNIYFQPVDPNVNSSAQTASASMTARFEAVPEPGTAGLLLGSGLMLALRRRRAAR